MFGNVLECLGVGTCLTDKENNTDEIMVYLPQANPSADGALVVQTEKETTTVKTVTGDDESSESLSSNGIPATWLNFCANRVTSPNVRNGSKVVIYKFKGSNTYYWTAYGLDKSYRLETIIYAISASPNINADTPIDEKNFYIFLISTHTGMLQVITGQGNGEFTTHNVTLNTKDGQFSYQDGEGDVILVDAKERAFTFANRDKTMLHMNKKNFTASCEDTMLLQGKEKIGLSCKSFTLRATDLAEIATKRFKLIAPDIYFEGNIKHIGKMHNTDGFTTDADMKAGSVSLRKHPHEGVKYGPDISGGPVGG